MGYSIGRCAEKRTDDILEGKVKVAWIWDGLCILLIGELPEGRSEKGVGKVMASNDIGVSV